MQFHNKFSVHSCNASARLQTVCSFVLREFCFRTRAAKRKNPAAPAVKPSSAAIGSSA
jgi:hypothetical protein